MPPRSTLRRAVSAGAAVGVVTTPKSCRSASVSAETDGVRASSGNTTSSGSRLRPSGSSMSNPKTATPTAPASAYIWVRRRPPIAASPAVNCATTARSTASPAFFVKSKPSVKMRSEAAAS